MVKGRFRLRGQINLVFLGDPSKVPKKVPSHPAFVFKQNGGNSTQKDQVVFKSSAMTSATNHNAKKKRLRVDPLVRFVSRSEAKSSVGVSTSGINLSDVGKDSHEKIFSSAINPYETRTNMNVEFLAGNGMRFRDEEDPPDPSNVKASVDREDHGKDMETDTVMDSAVGSVEHKQ
ncbi:RsmB/NOP family class I SAM-dependent RNA methyltransferase [Sesbania bispinosa]|nr:RsmB/NOP family class I SAM-dependent RNA methyltransferase [Sesbania bispinosa]